MSHRAERAVMSDTLDLFPTERAHCRCGASRSNNYQHAIGCISYRPNEEDVAADVASINRKIEVFSASNADGLG